MKLRGLTIILLKSKRSFLSLILRLALRIIKDEKDNDAIRTIKCIDLTKEWLTNFKNKFSNKLIHRFIVNTNFIGHLVEYYIYLSYQ